MTNRDIERTCSSIVDARLGINVEQT